MHSRISRYGTFPGSATGASNLDALNRVLSDLCVRGNPKDGAASALRRHVEEQARDLSGEAFSRFMDKLYDRITTLLESNEVAENLGALRAIDELIDVGIGENAVKVAKIANYMRTAFEAKREPETLVIASKVLGHLARAGGAMTADEVERLVKIALEWLRGDRVEYRRFAAVLILKEMAENASTVFNVHVPEFVDAIWVALRDPKLDVRERAVEALRACLRVIEKRETRWRVQCSSVLSLWVLLKLSFAYRDKYSLAKTSHPPVNRPCLDFTSFARAQPPALELATPAAGASPCAPRLAPQAPEALAPQYYRMFEATQDGLGRNAPIHSIHGSLLAVGELLRNTGEFMMSRYREVAEIVLRYLEHRDRLVRLSITSLLPRIAHFLRDRFVTNYLTICMKHILHVLKIPAEAASGFIALGEMAGALDGELINYLPTITSHLRDAIAPRRGRPSMEALACVGNIAKAMGSSMEPHVRSLLDAMFSAGLSSTLVEALENITASIPSLLPTIQVRLLECISGVLSRHQQVQSRPSNAIARTSSVAATLQVSELSGSALVQLALQTLARFNFKVASLLTVYSAACVFLHFCGSALFNLLYKLLPDLGHDLLEFARDSVVLYLEDDDGVTRKDAALCCCKLMSNSLSGISSAQFSSSRTSRAGGKRRRLVEENQQRRLPFAVLESQVLKLRYDEDLSLCCGFSQRFLCYLIVEKLLIAAVADADVTVRRSIFSSLHETGGFDDYLAQADCLTAVFAALNDEDFEVREFAISVAGRLSEKNPAYVLPALRRHLIQLLTYLKQSADSKCREESAKLLGCLIRNCERLILPYISPIHKALIAKLNEGTGVNANNGIISGVLVTVGDLARVGGFAMRQYIPELMPLIVEALLDGAAAMKREVAVTTLGQVVQSTGYVITPYNEYPQLLGLLLKLLNGELAWSTRREVLKVLGIMGALDPHAHKRNQLSLPGSHGEVARTAGDPGQHIRSMDELPMDLWPSFATSEDYFSTVAISSLMRIFRDPSLSSYHQKVVGSLIMHFNFVLFVLRDKAMGLGCVPYLPKVLPDLLHTVRTCDDSSSLKEYITWKLGTLVSIVRQHIRKYLPDLFSLISELWSSFSLPAANRPVRGSPILHLLEQLCLALNDEFRMHLPFILPSCIQVLSDAERFKDYTYVIDILRTLEVFGGTLDEHMHLLLPALIRVFKVDASVDVRRAAIRTLTKLIPRVQVAGHISALVHHLKLVLDGKNDELRKDAVDALCCLAHALGEDFAIFIPSIHKLLLKHHMRVRFQEIEGRLHRREPLILGNTASQKQTRPLPGEVISDPVSDTEEQERIDPHKPHKVNEARIRAAGEASQRSTKEDWTEWMRHFSIELLKESPSPALRMCAKLAQLQGVVFAAGFVSCWTQLNEPCRRQLVRGLEMAFSSPNIPPEILATLLNLCRAFAKALHYKEMEFEGACSNRMDGNPVAVVEALIHINNQLHQHEAAVGILTYAQQHLGVQLKESWYEKLQRWDDALKAYTVKASQASSPHVVLDATLGRMRCLAALARWEELNNLCKEYWTPAEPAARLEMAPMAASAAWNMGEWDQMAEYVSRLDDGDETKLRVLGNTAATGDGSSNGTFFRAVLLVRRGKYDEAREYVDRARKCLATEVAALCRKLAKPENISEPIYLITTKQPFTTIACALCASDKPKRSVACCSSSWMIVVCLAFTLPDVVKAVLFSSPNQCEVDDSEGFDWYRIRDIEILVPCEKGVAVISVPSNQGSVAVSQFFGPISTITYLPFIRHPILQQVNPQGVMVLSAYETAKICWLETATVADFWLYMDILIVLESYERAYSNMVRIQQLSELEEVIDYCTLPVANPVAEGRRLLIRNMWNERIKGAKRNVEVWQALLAVRSLVLPPTEDAETWIKFASLCRKSGRISQARSTLTKLLQFDPESTPETVRYHGDPQVILAYLKYQWSLGEDHRRKESFARLKDLAMDLSRTPVLQQTMQSAISGCSNMPLVARVYLKLGTWQWALSPEILNAFRNATHCATKWAKAWHKWALFNTAVMSHYTLRGFPTIAAQFVVAAVTGYFHSIACAAHAKGVDDSLQDILRLLTLWFNHGATSEVQMALQKGFSLVNINTWLVVLPQIIARIHSNNHAVRELIQSLLVRIGQSHPQALMYPLLVACKSISNLRKQAAQEVVDKVRQHSGVLVDEAQLVSTELIRVAILWHEMWHEALEEASRLYFGEHNIEGMLNVLEPLHKMLEEGAMRNNTTIKEKAFIQAYRHELLEAYDCCVKYRRTGKDAELTQILDNHSIPSPLNCTTYVCPFVTIPVVSYGYTFPEPDRSVSHATYTGSSSWSVLMLVLSSYTPSSSVSPELLECRDLKLAVPGTYKADLPVVTIASFAPQLVVITSKQRPRKLTINGSDGEEYAFLLKGHEDLRQDERVMQLFGLVNTLLANSRKTAEKDLSIQRYEVIPLSPNSGLIGWVPNCDTLHQLIREYRDARKITLNQEHKLMLSFAPDYDHLPLIAKVEVFEYALQNTEGNDLSRVGIFQKLTASPSSLMHAYIYFREMLGALVKESHFRGLVRQEDQLYKKLSCHEYGNEFLLRMVPLLNRILLTNFLSQSASKLFPIHFKLHGVMFRKRRDWCPVVESLEPLVVFWRLVGYLLGLGDRHPSNLMLHRYSGKILHIDFGDCFEASMNREKFPEKVPFRLTRMLVKAMEVSGLEGNFRSTCESVMQVLRTNKDSVMAMMEAFVHDPLINWRLFNFNEVPQMSTLTSTHAQPVVNGEESGPNLLQPQRGVRERELLQAVNQLGDANEVLNERAVLTFVHVSGGVLSGKSEISTCSISTLGPGNPSEVIKQQPEPVLFPVLLFALSS
ncbi:hypothetical protein DH2020_029313 [Rehmannia glutinosa]|uniref:non-specific serine/threonine protein kinase n=1 Tax=Rehmannia glutinosa TaxID=99300 RepID=A0ABR0VNX3_REHGL